MAVVLEMPVISTGKFCASVAAHEKHNLRREDFVINVACLLRRLQLQWSLAYVMKTKYKLLTFFS
jgi:hypothetical protein